VIVAFPVVVVVVVAFFSAAQNTNKPEEIW